MAATPQQNAPLPASPPAWQDARYLEAVQLHGAALARLARGYQADAVKRQDLLQDIHIALWRSLASFDGRCSLRTWVHRIAHITATRHITADRRLRLTELQTLDEIPEPADERDSLRATDEQDRLSHLLKLIERLKPLDRQVILLYLEDFSAEAIADMVGLSPENVATKIHRIKKLLAGRFKSEVCS